MAREGRPRRGRTAPFVPKGTRQSRGTDGLEALVARLFTGDRRAAARLITHAENDPAKAAAIGAAIHPRTGRARIVGITGAPGAGKSTLVDKLADEYRRKGLTVGIVAVDPSSPFTGGAILGDRIRMATRSTDPEVFIRSMGTRGSLGGVSRATADAVRILDAMGKDLVMVETVGVGQAEVEVAGVADTTVVVLAPGMGDEIQGIKAGIMEIGDLFVVNKADRDAADRTVAELEAVLSLGRRMSAAELAELERKYAALHGTRLLSTEPEVLPGQAGAEARKWEPPVVKTVATTGAGIPELAERLDAHAAHLRASGELVARRLRRAEKGLLDVLKERLTSMVLDEARLAHRFTDLARSIVARRIDPYRAAAEVLDHYLALEEEGAR